MELNEQQAVQAGQGREMLRELASSRTHHAQSVRTRRRSDSSALTESGGPRRRARHRAGDASSGGSSAFRGHGQVVVCAYRGRTRGKIQLYFRANVLGSGAYERGHASPSIWATSFRRAGRCSEPAPAK